MGVLLGTAALPAAGRVFPQTARASFHLLVLWPQVDFTPTLPARGLQARWDGITCFIHGQSVWQHPTPPPRWPIPAGSPFLASSAWKCLTMRAACLGEHVQLPRAGTKSKLQGFTAPGIAGAVKNSTACPEFSWVKQPPVSAPELQSCWGIALSFTKAFPASSATSECGIPVP